MPLVIYIVVVLLTTGLAKTENSRVNLIDNGYQTIVVAFHKNMQEELDLLENLKTLLALTSKYLYQVTNNRAYFRNVTIVVPSTWSSVEAEVEDMYRYSDIRVEVGGDSKYSPYMLQYGGCGQPGRYIGLSSEYGKLNTDLELKARHLARAWIKYRYGVFDENSHPDDNRFPLFYKRKGKLYPTTCNADVEGEFLTLDEKPCPLDEDISFPKECFFKPNHTDFPASLMSLPLVPQVRGLCDDENHNKLAFTKQNFYCDGRSVWSVLDKHPDFSHNNNLPSGYTPPEVSTPHFNVRRAKETDDYVILVDSSWNVQYTVGKEEVQRITNRIILEFLPDNATASLLVYSKQLKRLAENIKLDEFSNRKNLVESLETELNSTNIEDGQALGKALFKITQMENREGVSVVLLTNGDEDMTPFVTSHSVKAAIVNSGIRINTLLFGSQHKNKIQDLASITGGKLFIVETKKWDFNMASLVSAAVLQALVSTSNQEEYTHQLFFEEVSVKQIGVDIEVVNLYVDNPGEIKFVFSGPTVGDPRMNFLIKSPSSVISKLKSEDNNKIDGETIAITFSAEIGKWEIIPLSTFLQTQITLIRSYVTTKSDIFALEGWTITSKDDIPRISIFANLKDRSNVITGQKMNATVYCPGNKVQFVALRDDGLGADLSANDGVHSAHFTDFQGNGSYHVEVAVLVEDRDFVKSLLKERIQNIPEPQVITTPPKRYRNKHSLRIQRSCYAGSFYLKHNLHSSKGSPFPPSRVSDLQVTKVQQNQSTLNVTLQWTAPGGKLDTGQVAYYNFRRSFNISTLRTNFHSADNLTKDHLVGGELEPKERGQKQSAVFQILVVPYDYQEMFISMKSLNDEKNESPTSNIVPVYFEVTPPETTTTEFIDITSTESTTSENTDASTTSTIVTTNEITEENVVGLNLPVILLVSVFGSLSLLSLILISIFVLRVRKRKLSEPIRHGPRFESPRETTP